MNVQREGRGRWDVLAHEDGDPFQPLSRQRQGHTPPTREELELGTFLS